jgi:hypothetical protein
LVLPCEGRRTEQPYLKRCSVETKDSLRGHRRHALNAWLLGQHTTLDESPFWSPEFRQEEQAKFAELDAAYETAKAELSTALRALTARQLDEYFAAIGWAPVDATRAERVDDYIARG